MTAPNFPAMCRNCCSSSAPAAPGQKVRAVPGEGANVPVWILGSSAGGAQLAATLGLPFAFASHFAPDQLEVALATYRGRFVPSAHLAQAESHAVADGGGRRYRRGSATVVQSTAQQANDAPLAPPVANYEQTLDPQAIWR